MPRNFNVPSFYRSPGVSAVKFYRQRTDPRKQDLSPTEINFGPVKFKIARHFGFCFGVENAIEIAYQTLEENPGRNIFLVSEMIHNPEVNADLLRRGVRFLLDTKGNTIIPLTDLTADDIVIVPAFGTTIELQNKLSAIGINPYRYDATCPFVEKVWKRAEGLGKAGFTVIIHGKRTHEETKATFSHSILDSPTLIILDMHDAEFLISFMKGQTSIEDFKEHFKEAMSENFDPEQHLTKIGVINQTTMLATETKDIAKAIRNCLVELHGEQNIKQHFADTRDTLCYATNENQSATRALIDSDIDIAIIVGGYNSSNTSHLVELCEANVPTFYIKNAGEILSSNRIQHFDLREHEIVITENWLPNNNSKPLSIALTSGASCPDKTVDDILKKIVSFFPDAVDYEKAFSPFMLESELAQASSTANTHN
jgi:4-hydroxy-3-methylbut-2-enyl diphosphate reductase